MHHHDLRTIETLRLSTREKTKLVEALQSTHDRSGLRSDRERRTLHVNLPVETEIILTLLSDGGDIGRFSVLPRDLSRKGIGLVHGRFIYPGTRCEVDLPGLDGKPRTITGRVKYCQHVRGLIHELGVSFDSAIVLSDFVHLRPEEDAQQLRELAADPDAVRQEEPTVLANVLVIDDFSCDRKLLSHWLGQEGMSTSTLSTYEQQTMLGVIEEQWFDLIIVDMHLGSQNGEDIITMLRSAHVVSPILAISADDESNTRYTALQAGANAFLQKPFKQTQLIETVRQLMRIEIQEASEPIYSTHADDEQMKPLLIEFVRGLPEAIDKLRKANNSGDYEALEKLSYSLKSSGSGYGFDRVSEQAAEVMKSLNESLADITKIKQEVIQLVGILRRVRLN